MKNVVIVTVVSLSALCALAAAVALLVGVVGGGWLLPWWALLLIAIAGYGIVKCGPSPPPAPKVTRR